MPRLVVDRRSPRKSRSSGPVECPYDARAPVKPAGGIRETSRQLPRLEMPMSELAFTDVRGRLHAFPLRNAWPPAP